MKKIKGYFIMAFAILFCAFLWCDNNVYAQDMVVNEMNNFTIDNEKIIITNDENYPFVDNIKGEENVIKSGNDGVDDSSSTLYIEYTGIGEVCFYYMVSSEKKWDYLEISVNDTRIVKESGEGLWERFCWYSEDESNNVIAIKYYKDFSGNINDDCVYLKLLTFDETMYSPLLNFTIDDKTLTDSDVVYYDYGNNEGIINFLDVEEGYDISVYLNNNPVEGVANSYDLKNNEHWEINNNVLLEYCLEGYKTRVISFAYNIDLNLISGDLSYENDVENLFVVEEYDGTMVIKSTNTEKETYSQLKYEIFGSGVFSFDYLVSSKKDTDYFVVSIDYYDVFSTSGILSSFESFSYNFYTEGMHTIIFSYQRDSSDFETGDNCIYLNNINFEEESYVQIPVVKLNEETVNNGDKFVITNNDYKVSIGEIDGNTNVSVILNNETVDFNEENSGYLLENLEDVNFIEISFSSLLENVSDRKISFYLYKETIEKVFMFQNDLNNPFVRDIYNGEVVIRTNLMDWEKAVTSISYVATSRGTLSIEYLAFTDVRNRLIVEINGVIVMEDSNISEWKVFFVDLFVGDEVVISYVKDDVPSDNEDIVYFRNIVFEEKVYTSVSSGKIGDLPFGEKTKVLYFDWKNKDAIISFDDLKDSQSVIVNINGTDVDLLAINCDLSSYLEYINVVKITYIEQGYHNSVISFYYNAKLISDIEYVNTSEYILKNVDDEMVISLNDSMNTFDSSKLELNVMGKGFFSVNIKYFTDNNLNICVCFDNGNCIFVNESVEKNVWQKINYKFDNEGNHVISIIVSGEYYNDVDYLYMKDVSFFGDNELSLLIDGSGTSESPFDYSLLIERLCNIGLNDFEYSFYSEDSLTSIYVSSNEGYEFIINGISVSDYGLPLSLYEKGISSLVISDGVITAKINYVNQGINGSSISIGFGSKEKPFEISNEEQLRDISLSLDSCYALKENIELTSNWISIGRVDSPFMGCLDGKNALDEGNYTISNINIVEGELSGLFGAVIGARISNLNLDIVNITSGNIVGSLIGTGENVEVINVKVTNLNIQINNDLDVPFIVGGLVGNVEENGNFSEIEVNGEIVTYSPYQNVVGGLSGVGGNFYSSVSNVNVKGSGYVGGIIGNVNDSYLENIVVLGNVEVSSNHIEEASFGIIGSNENFILNNITHKISGTYINTGEIIVVDAYIYGQGINKNGIQVTLDRGSFEVDVVLDSTEILKGHKASFNGYVIRFTMSDDSYRYFELFDFANLAIRSNNIEINVDGLISYENNLSLMKVDNSSSYYGETIENGIPFSSYLNVYIDNVRQFEHLRYVVNYGLPTILGAYNIYGEYNLTLNFIIENDLDFSNSDFAGLANSVMYPYSGNVNGLSNNQRHIIKLNMNNSNSIISAFINYYESKENSVSVENIILEGTITGGSFAAFVGYYFGERELMFKNISNYMSVSANNSASLLAEANDTFVSFMNCENYSTFDKTIFYAGSGANVFVNSDGINKNYAVATNNEYASLFTFFFGTDLVGIRENAVIENYYQLDVGVKNVSLTIDGNQYTSDVNGLIIFKMENPEFYSVIISNELLIEKRYELNPSFRGSMVLPKTITFNDANNVYHKNGQGDWVLKATVELYDNTSFEIDLVHDLSVEQINGNELVFNNVSLLHDTYKVNNKVNLTRYTVLLEEYKDIYHVLAEASDDFVNKGMAAKNKYDELIDIYVEGNVSEETLEFYLTYLNENEMNEEKLNAWLAVIVKNISLKDEDLSVIYGDEVSAIVKVEYLDGNILEYDIDFDYAFSDIEDFIVTITSINAFVSKNGDVEVYNDYFRFSVPLIKRELEIHVDNYLFEYDGIEKEIVMEFVLSDKFDDSVSNLVVYYIGNGATYSKPVNAGRYEVRYAYELSNVKYYELSNIVIEELVISPREVDVIWEGEYESDYTGEEKISSLDVYYLDVNNDKMRVYFDVWSIINVGEYNINAIINDANYVVSEETKNRKYLVNKVDLLVGMDDYCINYSERLPEMALNITGLVNRDSINVEFTITRGDEVYDVHSLFEPGEYSLNVILHNFDELSKNYNITIKHGILTVLKISTFISANDVTYDYNSKDFNYDLANAVVKNAGGEVIEDANVKYQIFKDDVEVDEAVNAGEYLVKIVFEGNNIYSYSELTIDLVVNVIETTLKINDYISQYGDDLHELTYTIESGKVYDGDDLKVSLTKETGLTVGTYFITGTYDNPNYNIIFVNGVYEIVKRKVEISVDNKESYYNDDLQELTYSISSGSVLEGDNLNVVLSKEPGLNVGSYEVRATYDNNQYDATIYNGYYLIKKQDIKGIVMEDVRVAYSGESVNFGVNSDILSDGSKADITYYCAGNSVFEIVSAGVYEIEAVIENPNYNTLRLMATVVVDKAITSLGFDIDSRTIEYTGEYVSYQLENNIFEDGSIANVTYEVVKDGKNVDSIRDYGEYFVLVNIYDVFENYERKIITHKITVTKKQVAVKYGSNSLEYNGGELYPTVDSTINISRAFNTNDGNAPVAVGDYIMTVIPENYNYVIVNDVYSYSIAPVMVEYNNFYDREFDYNSKSFENDISIANIKNNDNVGLVFEYYKDSQKVEEILNAGSYKIKVAGLEGEDCSNYVIDNDNNEITVVVTPKKVEITPVALTKIYGDDDPVINYFVSSHLYDGDTIEGQLARESGENVGEYEIKIGTLYISDNYVLELNEEKTYFTIAPKEISIEYEEENFCYDGSEKKLEVIVSEGAHIEYIGDVINAGTYYVRVIIDDQNYCLPVGYEDILVVINKADISDAISLFEEEYVYDGSEIVPQVKCGNYSCVVKYFKDGIEVEDIVNPGTYTVSALIETDVELGRKEFEIIVGKMNGVAVQVSIEAYYNRIIVEQNLNLEYRIDNGEYHQSHVFTGLREETNYTVYVRSKETELAYASEPIVYNISTTKNPKIIHEAIDKLTENVTEKFKVYKRNRKKFKRC